MTEHDPVLRALEQAPADDEPLTEDDLEALQEAFEDRDEGRVRSHEEVYGELLGGPSFMGLVAACL
jgi:hypothetical protein